MSRPQPTPQSNFIQILLIFGMVYLGFQLFMAPGRENADERTSAEVLSEMQAMNRDLRDYSMTQTLRLYENKVRAEAKGNAEAEAAADQKVLEAYVLYADTALKSAVYRDQRVQDNRAQTNYGYQKLNRAYDTFKPKFEALNKEAAWKETVVTVFPTEEFPETEKTPEQVYAQMVSTLSPLAKAEPVFGFIPGYQVIDFLVNLTGAQAWFSYAFAAFLLAVVVRAIIWPLAQKQFIWGRRMQQLSPFMKEIQEKYKGKGKQLTQQQQVKMNEEIMGLYKEYGMNPFSGCGPMFIQLPFFLAVYQCMIHYKFEFTKGYFLWIQPGADRFLGIPLAPNLGERDYILVVIYMISMVVSTLMMPVSDPTNYKQQKLMGIGIAVLFSVFMFFYSLPSAFILYWIFTNILSTGQSLLAHRVELPPLEKTSTSEGGAIPTKLAEDDEKNGKSTNGQVDPGFFGKTGTPKANKAKKKKKR